MKDNIEKSLKRFLKRKAKITMGFITAFLITGSVGYALTITEDQIKDNTWTNESKIEEQIEVSESLLDKGITISNNGEIIVSEKVEEELEETPIGNGLGILVESLNLGNINNNGIISGNVNGNIENGMLSGNGIGIISMKDFNIGNIINNNTISGNVIGENISGTYLGNGIIIFLTGNLNIENIINTGKITGNVNSKTENESAFSSNGIVLYGSDIKVKKINNTGEIIGNTKTDGDIFSETISNGISIIGRNLEIASITNTGKILGKVNGNIVGASSGNGINIFPMENGNIKNIINIGEISGNVDGNIDEGSFSGNGINAVSEGIISLNIENIGKITGNVSKISGDSKEIYGIGNGLIIYDSFNENLNKIGDINNNGIISGNIDEILSKELKNSVLYGGNGISLNVKNSKVGNIENNGLIKGNINKYEKIQDEGLPDLKLNASLGNGIEITSIEDLNNIVQGKSKDSTIKQDNLTNKGIIVGNISEYQENINGTHSGNGIGYFYQNANKDNSNYTMKLSNIENEGFILGNAGDILNKRYINMRISAGNGIGISAHSGNMGEEFNGFLNNFSNIGKIAGNINTMSGIYSNTGNGLGISLVSLLADESFGKFTLNKINNDGIIAGNINNFDTTNKIEMISVPHALNSMGNGFGINVYAGQQDDNSLLINKIENSGKIAGNIGKIIGDNQVINNLGNGIGITTSYYSSDNLGEIVPLINKLNNTGIILGKEKGIYIAGHSINEKTDSGNIKIEELEKLEGKINNYSNAGIVAGKTPVFAEGFTDDIAKSADKGVAIKLDNTARIESITNGTGGEVNGKKVINADITDKDSSIFVDKETNYANNIINGAGVNSATLNVNAKTSVTDSIINAFATALKVNDSKEFSASNTTFNGGGLDGNTAVITDEGNSTISLDKSTINGNIALGKGDSKLAVTNSQINGDIAGGEGNDNLTVGGSSLYNKIDGFEDITFKVDTTLYETAKVAGANRIEIDSGTEVSLRVDSTKKADDGTYKEHALFNSSDKLLTLAGNTNAIGKDDVDKDGNLNVEENEGRVNYDKVSILNLVTSGLGLKSKIDLGNTKVDDTLWVKTDSILTQATKEENDKGTILNIEAEKDLFSINKKFDNPEPEPDPDKPVNPDKPVDPKPDKPVDPDVDPDKPVDPKPEPEKPTNIKYYTKLNDIYKGIYSSNDRNFNALNDIVTNYTFSDKDKGNYPIIGNDKAQMETLLGYLTSVYTQNPYAFSNQATRKAMNLFHDSVRDNNFKANNDEWLIYGGLLHQSGDQEQTYYGRNYHGFDTGTADVDADIKLTGAYGQFEYGLSDSLATGIMVGGSKSDIEVGPSKVKGTGAYVGAYAKKDINNFRFTTGLGYQYTEYDGNRRTINEAYSSDYQDQAINLYVDGKYSHDLGNNLFLEPKAGLSYTHIDQDSIKENDKALALDIEAKDFDVLEGTVGVDIKKVIPTEKGTHTLTAGISYNHILDGDNADSLRANYGGSKFDVLVPHKNKGQVSLGAKYEVELENGMFYDVKGNYYVPTDSKDSSNKNADKGEWRVGVGFGYKF